MKYRVWDAFGPSVAFLLASSCGPDTAVSSRSNLPPAPHVAAVSAYEASLGTPLDFYVTGFPADQGAAAYPLLVFDGMFRGADGSYNPVQAEFPARFVDQSTLRWTQFGPDRNPLSPDGDQLGRFEGTVAVRLVRPDGPPVTDAHPLPITLEVRPSIVVDGFAPLGARCGGMVVRALGGLPYGAHVRALGFTPAMWEYAFSVPGTSIQSRLVRHVARGDDDALGGEELVLPEVPDGAPSITMVLAVTATASNGQSVSTAFAMGVHRPLEFYYNGNLAVAEAFPPTPVSGCLPGGPIWHGVSYVDTHVETRSRTVNLRLDESWTTNHSVTNGTSDSRTLTMDLGNSNSIAVSTTNGHTFGWSTVMGTMHQDQTLGEVRHTGTVELGGTLGVSSFLKAEAQGKVSEATASANGWWTIDGRNTSMEQNGQDSMSQGTDMVTAMSMNHGEATTEASSAAVADGNAHAMANGRDDGTTVSSSDALSRGVQYFQLPNTPGVFYRQTLRLLRRGMIVVNNLCGVSKRVGDVDYSDYTWAPDFAMGPQGASCFPLPPSNLPAARCLIQPCEGEYH